LLLSFFDDFFFFLRFLAVACSDPLEVVMELVAPDVVIRVLPSSLVIPRLTELTMIASLLFSSLNLTSYSSALKAASSPAAAFIEGRTFCSPEVANEV